jgi:hypothetical protein
MRALDWAGKFASERPVREGKPFQATSISDAYDMEGLVDDDLRDVAPSLSRVAVYPRLLQNVTEF